MTWAHSANEKAGVTTQNHICDSVLLKLWCPDPSRMRQVSVGCRRLLGPIQRDQCHKEHPSSSHSMPPLLLSGLKNTSWTSLVVQWMTIRCQRREQCIRSLIQEEPTFQEASKWATATESVLCPERSPHIEKPMFCNREQPPLTLNNNKQTTLKKKMQATAPQPQLHSVLIILRRVLEFTYFYKVLTLGNSRKGALTTPTPPPESEQKGGISHTPTCVRFFPFLGNLYSKFH